MQRIAFQNHLSDLTGDGAGCNIMAFTKKSKACDDLAIDL
jgi:hypothetical protein